VQILRYGFLPDTGGPGRHRGGLALVREYRFLEEEGILQIRSDRHRSRPYGLAGGRPGAPSQNILNPEDEARVLPSKTLLTIRYGDVLRHVLAGAGGHGDPFTRDPQKVLDDVQDEKVTLAAAERDYGVAIDSEAWAVDHGKTGELRRSLLAKK